MFPTYLVVSLQDFYQFACGNWDKSHPIPEGRSVRSSFETFVNDVVDLYRGMYGLQVTYFQAGKSF